MEAKARHRRTTTKKLEFDAETCFHVTFRNKAKNEGRTAPTKKIGF